MVEQSDKMRSEYEAQQVYKAHQKFDRRRFLAAGAAASLLAGAGLWRPERAWSAARQMGGAVEPSLEMLTAANVSTLIIASATAVDSLDPNTLAGLGAQAAWQICYDTLYDISTPPGLAAAEAYLAHFNPIPRLASSWTPSKNGTVWEFSLNPTVKSSAGNPLSPADVIWSAKRHLALQLYGGIFLNRIGVTSASQFTATGDHGFQLSLPAPIDQSFMLQLLGALIVPIYDSVEVQKHATASDQWAQKWMQTHTAGFGPYVVESMATDGSQTVFKARTDYYGQVRIPTVIWKQVADTSTQLELLLRGNAHVTDQLSPEQIKTVAAHKGTKVTQVATAGTAYMGFDNSQSPFKDVALHQGLAYGISFDSIVQGVWKGTAQPMKSVLPPWFQGATSKYWAYAYDPEKAKALLKPYASAGLALQYDAGNDLHTTLAELIQGALSEVGMTIHLDGIDSVTYANDESKGTHTWWLDTTSVPVIPDSLYALQLLFLTKPTQILLHYSNAAVDAAVAQLQKTESIAEQDSLIAQAQQHIMADLPVIPIAYTGQSVTSVSNLYGFRGHGGNTIRATDLTFK